MDATIFLSRGGIKIMKSKKNRLFIIAFTLPCALSLFILYLYLIARTVIMSFFGVESVTASTSNWSFNGIAAIYLPNVISAVALATMWIQYIYNQEYGLLNRFLGALGLEGKNWLGTDMKFWAMLFAFVFGAVGYYMLIFINGIERIPGDIFEAATIDGANKIQQFFSLTMPLLRSIFKTNITFWSINCISFFLWSKMFAPVNTEASTVVPVVYLYDTVFGTTGNVTRDAGAGAAIGVVLSLFVAVIYFIMNKVIKDDDLEF